MKTKPVHIHLAEVAKPEAVQTLIPVPLNLQKAFEDTLDEYMESEFFEKVGIGKPVTWCSQMLVTKRAGSDKIRLVTNF